MTPDQEKKRLQPPQDGSVNVLKRVFGPNANAQNSTLYQGAVAGDQALGRVARGSFGSATNASGVGFTLGQDLTKPATPLRPPTATPAAPRITIQGPPPSGPAVAAAAPVVAAPKAGDPNTFTGSSGTRAIAPTAPAPAASTTTGTPGPTATPVTGAPTPTLAPPAAYDAYNPNTAYTGFVAPAVPGPTNGTGSNFQRSENIRRAEHAAGGFKGSPSARMAMVNAYLDQNKAFDASQQLSQQTAASLAQTSLQGANAGALQTQKTAGEGVQARLLQQGAERLTQLKGDIDANAPSQITDASGNVVQVRGTTATPITGADGKALRAPQGKQDGAVTPIAALDSLTKQLGAYDSITDPDGSQRAALQQQIQSLMPGGQQQAAAPPAAAIAKLKQNKGNPKALSDFEAAFGLAPGSAAQYLGN